MRLGFYYHVPIQIDKITRNIITYGYLGCFLDSLLPYVDELVFFAHELDKYEPLDYKLDSRIRIVSLGKKPNAFLRLLWGKQIIRKKISDLKKCDIMLVRAPTPLLSAWSWATKLCNVQLIPLMVGNYAAANSALPFSFPKKQLLMLYNNFIGYQEKQILYKLPKILVNSRELYNKFTSIGCNVSEIHTTTLTNECFSNRELRNIHQEVKLVYAGRFDWNKGLLELAKAVIKLNHSGKINTKLLMIGWEVNQGAPVERSLRKIFYNEGLIDKIIFLGNKKVGKELCEAYCQGDIFVLPSYAEGFPRVIWEAMAAKLPVIATKVGSIPQYLTNGKNAWLISPHDIDAIYDGVLQICNNENLYHSLVLEGEHLARENTLDTQAKILFEKIALS